MVATWAAALADCGDVASRRGDRVHRVELLAHDRQDACRPRPPRPGRGFDLVERVARRVEMRDDRRLVALLGGLEPGSALVHRLARLSERDGGADPDRDQDDERRGAGPQCVPADPAADGLAHAQPRRDRDDEPCPRRHQRARSGEGEEVRQAQQGLGGDPHRHDADDRDAPTLRGADDGDGEGREPDDDHGRVAADREGRGQRTDHDPRPTVGERGHQGDRRGEQGLPHDVRAGEPRRGRRCERGGHACERSQRPHRSELPAVGAPGDLVLGCAVRHRTARGDGVARGAWWRC